MHTKLNLVLEWNGLCIDPVVNYSNLNLFKNDDENKRKNWLHQLIVCVRVCDCEGLSRECCVSSVENWLFWLLLVNFMLLSTYCFCQDIRQIHFKMASHYTQPGFIPTWCYREHLHNVQLFRSGFPQTWLSTISIDDNNMDLLCLHNNVNTIQLFRTIKTFTFLIKLAVDPQ